MNGDLVVLSGLVQPAPPVGDGAHEEIPLPIPGHPLQKTLRPLQVSPADRLTGLGEHTPCALPLLLIGGTIAVAALPLGGGSPSIAGTASGPGSGDGVICLVDLLHLLLGQISQGVILVVVRVILSCQLTVCLFNLIVISIGAHTQHLIGISHLAFSLLSLISFQRPSSTALCTLGRPV